MTRGMTFPAFKLLKFFVMAIGNTMNCHKSFVENLKLSSNLREVDSVNDCDVIIAFVSIVSRAGTDIEAALHRIPAARPLVLVALHHTFDVYYVAPDSRLCVQGRSDVFAVDCLYHEDQGLLRCLRNDEAIKAVKQHLRAEVFPEEMQSRPRKNNTRVLIGTAIFFIFIIILLIMIAVLVGKQ